MTMDESGSGKHEVKLQVKNHTSGTLMKSSKMERQLMITGTTFNTLTWMIAGTMFNSFAGTIRNELAIPLKNQNLFLNV